LTRFALNTVFLLIRLPVTVAVTFSAFTAWVVFTGSVTADLVLPVTGIFLLAAGASALNQYQERNSDARMERTRRRPIPSGAMTPAAALLVSVLLIAAGLSILILFSGVTCSLLGFFNILWYNGLYTRLKRKSAFAVVPGALTGALPVLMGWSAAGGQLTDPVAIFLSLFLFFWQMPHFWLLMLKYGEDYRAAGFPVLNDLFTGHQVKLLIMAWLAAASAASILLILFGFFRFHLSALLVLFLNLLLFVRVFFELFIASSIRYRSIFITANLFMLLVMGSLIADRLL
jgi:protoheme IX farnesyltransferase